MDPQDHKTQDDELYVLVFDEDAPPALLAELASCPSHLEPLGFERLLPPSPMTGIALPSEEESLDLPAANPDAKDDAAERARMAETAGALERELAEELLFSNAEAGRRVSWHRLARAVTWVAAVGWVVPLVAGWSYYSMPLAERPFSGLHAIFRPSGSFGLSTGVLGTLLIALSLLYPLRKRLPHRFPMGSLQGWMSFHIAAGVLGPALILLHSSFLLTSPLATMAMVSMGIVVLSGVAGRYLLIYMPAAMEHESSTHEEVGRRLSVYKQKLARFGIPRKLLGEDTLPVARRTNDPITSLIRVLAGDQASRREYRRLAAVVRQHSVARDQARIVLVLIRRLCRERQLFVRYRELRNLVATWRFLHVWFAILLLVGAVFHIALAVRFGGLWILGGGS